MSDVVAAPAQLVYPLWHRVPSAGGGFGDKLLGIYATRQDAEERINNACELPGFCDFPDAFHIDEHEVGRDKWVEGFLADSDMADRIQLTVDEAFRATFRFIAQYYERERITPFLLMLHSMTAWGGGDQFSRSTSDPATWNDWMKSVDAALSSDAIPEFSAPDDLPDER